MVGVEQKCAIWDLEAQVTVNGGDSFFVNSPRAGGKYTISGSALEYVIHATEKDKVTLTNWLVEQRLLGNNIPNINTTNLSALKSATPPSPTERAHKLLMYLYKNTSYLGQRINFDEHNEGYLDKDELILLASTSSINLSEVSELANYCEKMQWIKLASDGLGKDISLTPQGYEKLDNLSTTNAQSKQAFVAMWFDDSMNDAYENAIAPGIQDAGYIPVRIDQIDHNNKIDDEIIAEIRRSKFLVADFTHGDEGMRGGVYYEAGFAHGLNIPVIFTCRQDVIGKVHFDTRQYNHIVWHEDRMDEFRKTLSNRISATIGDGPLKNLSN